MKNVFKLKAILRIAGLVALVAIIGFSMVACGDDGGGPGGSVGGGGGSGGGSGGGTLIITGIPSKYNGMYLEAFELSCGSYDICTYDPHESYYEAVLPLISNGRVSAPLWKKDRFGDKSITRYSGNDAVPSGWTMNILDDRESWHELVRFTTEWFKFSNGNATFQWNEFRIVFGE